MVNQENNHQDPEMMENATEPTSADSTPGNTLMTLEEAQDMIRNLQAQVDEAKSRHLYLMSDFENTKRHAARERIEMIQTAGRDILAALLPVLDDFDRALRNGALNEGTTLIHNKLVHILQSKGLHSMDVQRGDEFNVDRHEAIVETPVSDESHRGLVVDILEQGYVLGERILRHAKVVVGK